MSTLAEKNNDFRLAQWLIGLMLIGAAWVWAYAHLDDFTQLVVDRWFNIPHGSYLYDATSFFVFEVPKVLLLLALIVFLVGVIQTFFSPEKTRQILAGRRQGAGNVIAATLGIVTPFCSCSAVPLFIGFLT
ncbi:MAG: permease, partial [Burkholderiales bacterium]